MRVVCISDTHNRHRELKIPPADLLLHAGDITFARYGDPGYDQIADFNEWLGELPVKHKVVIAGNHDFGFVLKDGHDLLTNATYLQDEGCVVGPMKIWGSPWQPEFYDWAFNLPRGEPLRRKWAMIPDDADIVVTHGPPFDVCDRVRWEHVGCKELHDRLVDVQPLLHVCGHIHVGYGNGRLRLGDTRVVNASQVNGSYVIANKPVVVDL